MGSRKTNIEGGLPKKGGLGQFYRYLRRGLARKRGEVFLRGEVDTPMHTMVPFIFSIGVLPYDNAHFINIVCFLGNFARVCVCLWPLLSSLITSSLVSKEAIDLVAYLSSSQSNKSKFSSFSS